MGILDLVKGLFESEAVQGALGSTPLSDVVDQVAPVGDAAAMAETVGIDPGQLTEVVPAIDSLPPDLGALAEPVADLSGVDPPAG